MPQPPSTNSPAEVGDLLTILAGAEPGTGRCVVDRTDSDGMRGPLTIQRRP